MEIEHHKWPSINFIEGHEWCSIHWVRVMTALITLLSIQEISTRRIREIATVKVTFFQSMDFLKDNLKKSLVEIPGIDNNVVNEVITSTQWKLNTTSDLQ